MPACCALRLHAARRMCRGMACIARRIPRCTPDRAGRMCAGRAWRTEQPRSSCSSKSAESARSQRVATVIRVALPHSPVERERPEHCLQLCVAVDHVPRYLRTEQLLHRTQLSPRLPKPRPIAAVRKGRCGPRRVGAARGSVVPLVRAWHGMAWVGNRCGRVRGRATIARDCCALRASVDLVPVHAVRCVCTRARYHLSEKAAHAETTAAVRTEALRRACATAARGSLPQADATYELSQHACTTDIA